MPDTDTWPYWEFTAGPADEPTALLVWGWDSHDATKAVACQILGKTIDQAFDALGADGRTPYLLEGPGASTPCISANAREDGAIITTFEVRKLLSVPNDSHPVLAQFTTTLKEAP